LTSKASPLDSSDLDDAGFSTWSPFHSGSERGLLTILPLSFGVYAVRCQDWHQTVKGRSDLDYIGSAANQQGLRNRIRQYFHPGPTQSTDQRVIGHVSQSARHEIAFEVCEPQDAAKTLELALLRQYELVHGELPPVNRRGY
jgi:hypothetical protein